MRDGNLCETLVKKRKERRGEDSSRSVMKTPGPFFLARLQIPTCFNIFCYISRQLDGTVPPRSSETAPSLFLFAPHAATPWPLTSDQYITNRTRPPRDALSLQIWWTFLLQRVLFKGHRCHSFTSRRGLGGRGQLTVYYYHHHMREGTTTQQKGRRVYSPSRT